MRRIPPKTAARKKPLTARELFVRDIGNANSLAEIYMAVVMHAANIIKCGDVSEIEHYAHIQIDNIDVHDHDHGHQRQHDNMAFFIYTCAYLNRLAKSPRKTFPFYTIGDPITDDARLPQWFLDDINKRATDRLLNHFINTVLEYCVGDPANCVADEEAYEKLVIQIQKQYNVNLIDRRFHDVDKLPKWMR